MFPNIVSAVFVVLGICLIHSAIEGQICSQFNHQVDFEDIDFTIWTRTIENFTMDPDLSLQGAGSGNIIVVSSNYHSRFDIDFQFATTVKNVSLRVLFAYNISLEFFDTAGTSLSTETVSVPSFSWFTTEFTNIVENVGRIRITWVMDEQGLEMGIKRLYVTTCPECPDSTETIDYGNTNGMTLQVTPTFQNPNELLAGSLKKRKLTMAKQIEATFNPAVTIQMVRLQIKAFVDVTTFNVSMYDSTTASFASQIFTDRKPVPGTFSWSNDLHVIPFSPIQAVKLITISFTIPEGFIRVRNLAFDKCVVTS